ncbi:DUF4276 family protein [Acidovorax sp. MR-S7]|uniref:DUF4276 family protein n=1 Tax=Acidovorax sp. MR-S7 TaxID=1268622 RepID=UPI00036223DC|nr:DUF4276 family protein [Acidovorax sp. MR-S7]GAD24410.1 hypothetical protein AVS7_04170 [Acidovorax sp. MR-S7]
MIEHVVFLLEEPSARDFLEAVLPAAAPGGIQVHFMVFEGKQDLERQLPRKLRGWLRPHTRFIVMRDQDSGDCKLIKQRLRQLCVDAGRPDAVIRIACRELEAFFVGDWAAVAEAFHKPALAAQARLAKYRAPDVLESPSRELMKHVPGYQKRDGARRISRCLQPQRNASGSYAVLWRTLLGLIQAR